MTHRALLMARKTAVVIGAWGQCSRVSKVIPLVVVWANSGLKGRKDLRRSLQEQQVPMKSHYLEKWIQKGAQVGAQISECTLSGEDCMG